MTVLAIIGAVSCLPGIVVMARAVRRDWRPLTEAEVQLAVRPHGRILVSASADAPAPVSEETP